MSTPQAGSEKRYRCKACGNLTRFNVTQTLRTKAFHHFTTGSELIDRTEIEVLALTVEAVECRWCGPTGDIEVISVP